MHAIGNWLYWFLGLQSTNNPRYNFWSGFGGDVAILGLLGGVIRAVFSIKKHLDKHNDQLKRHIDYRLHKLDEEQS